MALSFYYYYSLYMKFFINLTDNELADKSSKAFIKSDNSSALISRALSYGFTLDPIPDTISNPIIEKSTNKNFFKTTKFAPKSLFYNQKYNQIQAAIA